MIPPGKEKPSWEWQGATLNRMEMEECLNRTVKLGRKLSLLVTGHSMGPLLRHEKDTVVLVSPDACPVKRLDIVLFCNANGKYVMHRIIRCLPQEQYLINGDAQLWTEQIKKEQVQAVAVSINRCGRTISCDGRLYRSCMGVWVLLKPIRGIFITVYRWFHGMRKNPR